MTELTVADLAYIAALIDTRGALTSRTVRDAVLPQVAISGRPFPALQWLGEVTGVRVVPPAVARRGSFLAKNVVMMPSFVNIGAYVDEGTMVDTWAAVGSCAQIGKNVHLSGGVGIGGVLEPMQANPL